MHLTAFCYSPASSLEAGHPKRFQLRSLPSYRHATSFAHMHRRRAPFRMALYHNHEFAWHWLEYFQVDFQCSIAAELYDIGHFPSRDLSAAMRFRISPQDIQYCADAAFVNLHAPARSHGPTMHRGCADSLMIFFKHSKLAYRMIGAVCISPL